MKLLGDLKFSVLCLLPLAAPLIACDGELDPEGRQVGEVIDRTGGSDASGGSVSTGGVIESGGTTTTGGNATTGGSATTGGVAATGGLDESGGSQASGGSDEPFVPDPSKAGVFIVQGHMGRLMMTCDNGASFVVDQNRDDNVVCFSGTDCDHNPNSAQGVTFGDGQVMATFGWGMPGAVMRSVDGRNWTPVTTDTTFAGVAYGDGDWVGAAPIPWLSSDGQQWSPRSEPVLFHTPRRIDYTSAAGGRFVLFFDGPDIQYSGDGGQTWTASNDPGTSCGKYSASGGGVLLFGEKGWACRTDDGGETFTEVTLPGTSESNLVYAEGQFKAWGRGEVYTSEDGMTFTATATSPSDLVLNGVAYSPEGVYLGYRSEWDGWYDKALFYRSTDGITWQETESATAAQGHPLKFIAHGYLDKSVCE